MDAHHHFLELAVALSKQGMDQGSGGPFGCVIVRDGVIVGKGCNQVFSSQDATAHAEVVAIRDACHNLGTAELCGCIIYTSAEPCPMCMAAIYWSRAEAVYYANTKEDSARVGFDDTLIYSELKLPPQERQIKMTRLDLPSAAEVFKAWDRKPGTEDLPQT